MGSIFMADEVEKKIENPPAARSLEEIVRASQFTDKSRQNTWTEATSDYRSTQKESATMEALSDEKIAEIKAKGGFQKFELFDDAAPEPRKTFVDPHPSYVEGLKAVGDNEEEQGRFSIEYIERKATEALAALQKPTAEPVLIASNIDADILNLDQKQQYQEIQSDSEKPKIAQYSDGFMPPPTLVPSFEQLGLDQMWHMLDNVQHQAKHRFRGAIGETLKEIPEQSWSEAYKKFPQFKEAGLTEKKTIELMQAIARNELYFYDLGDALDDNSMRETGKPMQYPFKNRPEGAATLGISQVSVDGVKKFVREFPTQMGAYAGHEAESLLNPKLAPMMIAAVLAHNIRDYKGHYPINERTLAYSFNPDVPGEKGKKPPFEATLKESEHCANVMRQLAIIRGQVVPKPDEK